MRPNRIGWGLVGLFLAVGVVFTAIAPDIWLGEAYIGCAIALALFYGWMSRRADRGEHAIREGVRREAEILSVEQTGAYVNQQPRVRLRLRVHGPEGDSFEVEHTYTVPLVALDALGVGRRLAVYFERGDSRHFTIDWSSGEESHASAADRLRELNELRDAGLVDEGEFERQRGRIIDAI